MKNVVGLSMVVLALFWPTTGAAQKWTPIASDAEKPAAVEVKLVASDARGITVEMTLPGFKSWEEKVGDETYQHLEIPGGGYTADIGSPELPVVSTHLEVPFGAQAEVEVTDSQFRMLPDYNIYPAQEPWADFEQAEKPPFTKDEAVYSKDAFFPEQMVRTSKAGELRGYRVVFLAVFPVQYNPVKKELKVYSRFTLRLNYTERPTMTADLETKAMKRKAKFSKDFEPLYRATILNYEPPSPEVARMIEAPPDPAFVGADYLIITPDAFYNAVLPLKTHRETVDGFSVKTVKLSAVPPGNASAIKNYIQNAYDTWTPPPTYVLLVGDADYLPTNYVTDHPSNTEQYKKIGTDLYYSTVSGGDYLPDIFLGRLPGNSPEEITLMVDRIKNYETNPPVTTKMFCRVLLAAYEQSGRYFIATSDDIANHLTSQEYSCTKVYTGGSYTGTTAQVVNAINDGVFLAIHRDHGDSRNGPYGSTDGWGHPQFYTANAASLSNGNKVPVMFSINCRSGWFDGETDKDGGTTITDCLGEALLKHTGGGVVGFFGSTRISYSGYNDQLTKGFIDAIYPSFDPAVGSSTSVTRLGQILNYGKSYMYDTYVLTGGAGYPRWSPTTIQTKTEYEEFHLLGDPAMKIRIEKCKPTPPTPQKKFDCGNCGSGSALAFLFILGYLSFSSFKQSGRGKRSKGE